MIICFWHKFAKYLLNTWIKCVVVRDCNKMNLPNCKNMNLKQSE